MAALRFVTPVLAVAAGAAAQACGGTTTIESAADATKLANSCGSRTFSGDIVIATGVTEAIALDSITGISGDLRANNVTGMASLSASSVQSMGKFILHDLTTLTNLNFPSLVKAESIDWVTLPNLATLSFSQEGVQELDSLSIADTQLGSLEGINLQMADTIDITQNKFLQTVSMQIANVSGSLSITDNGDQLMAEFPNLIWANNMSIRAVAGLDIPSLEYVNGSFGVFSSSLESLSGPNLTEVGDFSVVMCDSLNNLTFPELTTINDGFTIANNSALEKITGFPKVASVGGALDFNGVYSEVELPALKNVRGGFNLQSTEDINDACDHFQDIHGPDKPIKGDFVCTRTDDPQGEGSLPDGTVNADGSSPTTNAAHPMLIPGATGVLGVIAAIFGLL